MLLCQLLKGSLRAMRATYCAGGGARTMETWHELAPNSLEGRSAMDGPPSPPPPSPDQVPSKGPRCSNPPGLDDKEKAETGR